MDLGSSNQQQDRQHQDRQHQDDFWHKLGRASERFIGAVITLGNLAAAILAIIAFWWYVTGHRLP